MCKYMRKIYNQCEDNACFYSINPYFVTSFSHVLTKTWFIIDLKIVQY